MTLPDTAVERDGKVALVHHNSNPSRPITIGEQTYQATPKFNISLMWVDIEDAEKIVTSPELKTRTCNCSGGISKPLFRYANLIDVSVHETGDRPR